MPRLTRIDRELVDSSVPLGEDEVEFPVLTERAPLRVDDHVFLKQLEGIRVRRTRVRIPLLGICIFSNKKYLFEILCTLELRSLSLMSNFIFSFFVADVLLKYLFLESQ